MSAVATTPPNLAGDIARLGALLAAIEELACELEDHVERSGYNLVTAIQACAEAAKRHIHSADEALAFAAKAKGGAA